MRRTASTRLLFITKSLLRMLLLLVCVSVAAFALVSLSPVDPLQVNVGQAALGSMSREQVARLESYWGVNEPPVARYLAWAGDFIRGDMGVSLGYRRSVASVIGGKLSNSLLLMAFAWVTSGIVGFALGIVAGVNRDKPLDRIIRGYALITASTPAFWLALLALLIFAVWLGLFPVGLSVPIGMEEAAVTLADRLKHAFLPAAVLSVTGISGVALHTREKLIDVMESDYALFAAARGESTLSIVTRHGLRNVILPAITLQFAAISEIFGGSVLVEQVFSYPGLGQAAVTAGLGGDIPLLMGITVIAAAIVFTGNFIANLLYGVIDPRMRRGNTFS
jgi:peptide/nickel transport system permease protein